MNQKKAKLKQYHSPLNKITPEESAEWELFNDIFKIIDIKKNLRLKT